MIRKLAAAFLVATAGAPLDGRWAFDPYLSDHPEQIARALRFDSGQFSPDDLPPEAVARGAGRAPGREPPGESDRKTFDALTEAVRVPPRNLTITRAEDAITISAGDTAVTLRTDGRAEKYSLMKETVQRTARWEGPQLVVVHEIAHGGRLTCRYGLAPTTGQLVIRVTFQRRADTPAPFEIRLVYNRTP